MLSTFRFSFCISVLVFLLLPFALGAQSLTTADSLHEIGEYRLAITSYDNFIRLKGNIQSIDLGNAYLRKAIDLTHTGRYNEAVEGYLKALEIFEKIKNPERIATTYSNLAYLYSIQQNTEMTGKYLDKSLNIFRDLNDSPRIAEILNDQALLAYEINNTRAAISIHEEALRDYKRHMPESLISKHLYNLGSCYEKINTDSALFYYVEATKLAMDAGDSSMLSAAYANMGDIYKQQGRFRDALNYLNMSLALNEEYGDSTDLGIIYHNLSDVYDSVKDYKKAFEYSVKERQINEWLYNAEKNKFSTELAEKYESGKKDEMIRTQQAESRVKSRNLLIALLGLLLVAMMAILAFYQYRQKKKANLILQDSNDRIGKLNRELDASNQVKTKLFSVISHDIRAPVSSLYGYLQLQGREGVNLQSDPLAEHVTMQTGQLLEVLEELLMWSKTQMNEFVPVQENVRPENIVRDILIMHDASIKARQLTIINTLPSDIVLLTDFNMLSVVLRNLIGNAIKYALPSSDIEISGQQAADRFSVIIRNRSIAEHINAINSYGTEKITSVQGGLGVKLIKEFAGKLQARMDIRIEDDIITITLSHLLIKV